MTLSYERPINSNPAEEAERLPDTFDPREVGAFVARITQQGVHPDLRLPIRIRDKDHQLLEGSPWVQLGDQ